MISDDELRKLMPALPECDQEYRGTFWHSEDQIEAHALATARAVWEAAIERAAAFCEEEALRRVRVAEAIEDDDSNCDEAKATAWQIKCCAAAIRSIGSREETSRTLSSEGKQT
jgi:hypothetical protein